ncbi:MAG: hypothetical protein M1822_008297 [Bathelium mastoideum]|nr:MAG: hypothetical protein M1822_008297 [Bathelium mastoideum]
MKIACIGAGASGLCFAYKLQRSFEQFSLTIFEKNAEVGGVWFENRYPGCACDYPAHNYTFSWESKADWSSVYASAPEVKRYFEDFSKKNDLVRFCKFNSRVTKATWHDKEGRWWLNILPNNEDEYSDHFDIVVNACGVLNAYKWPQIPGIEKFDGLKIHSANWKEPGDLTASRVGLIGNGSSGQQLLEALQPRVKNLTVFIRQPTWVLGPFGEAPTDYAAEEIDDFKKKPGLLLEKRKKFESRVNSYFAICLKNSVEQTSLRTRLAERIKTKLRGQMIQKAEELFIPQYAVGCRRPTPGVKYVESLCAPNVDIVIGNIDRMTTTGIIDGKGHEHRIDVLICATGFDTTHRPHFPILGIEGRNLQDEWRDQAQAYLALAVARFPNYFVFYGPNNPFASGAFLSTIEAQADYTLKWCDRWQTENIHSFAPKFEAVEDFQTHASEVLQNTVWADSCNSWYKNGSDPKVISLWPGSGLHYIEAISSLRGDDWEVKYTGNRFSWLGNGFSQVEQDPECDLAYYIREQDDSELLSSRKKRRAIARGSRIDPKSLHVIG